MLPLQIRHLALDSTSICKLDPILLFLKEHPNHKRSCCCFFFTFAPSEQFGSLCFCGGEPTLPCLFFDNITYCSPTHFCTTLSTTFFSNISVQHSSTTRESHPSKQPTNQPTNPNQPSQTERTIHKKLKPFSFKMDQQKPRTLVVWIL